LRIKRKTNQKSKVANISIEQLGGLIFFNVRQFSIFWRTLGVGTLLLIFLEENVGEVLDLLIKIENLWFRLMVFFQHLGFFGINVNCFLTRSSLGFD
jgi:hypothetical protein